MLPEAQADQTSRFETHRFNMRDCGFQLSINVAMWERQARLVDTYVATATKTSVEARPVYIQAVGKRKVHINDPAAKLFDSRQCVAQDGGEVTTAAGRSIRLQEAACRQSGTSADSHSPTGQHRLYGTVYGHWSTLGLGLFASSAEDLAKYKPAFVQILKTFEHQCPFEFLPLETGTAAEVASKKALDRAVKEAAAAASVQAKTESAAKSATETPSAFNTTSRARKQQTVPTALEWRLVLGNECKFAFQAARGKWGPDTFEDTEALIPISSNAQSKIFLTAANYFFARGNNGAWSATTSKKCALERRGTVKTADGREAPLFLASNCQKDSGFNANLNKKNILYGFVQRGEDDADYMVLASDDKSLLLKHEDELIGIIGSHTDKLLSCRNYAK